MSAPAAPDAAASPWRSAAPYVGGAALLVFLCLVRRRRQRTHALRESKKRDASKEDDLEGGHAADEDEEWEDFDPQDVAEPEPEPEPETEVDPFAELGMAPSLKKTKTRRHAAHNPVWGGTTTASTSSRLAMDDDEAVGSAWSEENALDLRAEQRKAAEERRRQRAEERGPKTARLAATRVHSPR